MKSMSIPEVRKSAEETFSSGLNCAESTALATATSQGIETELLPRMATVFGGGMARSCGQCGALTGAMMGISLALGRSAAGESVEAAYAATQRLVHEFEDVFGSRNCQALLGGIDLGTPEGQATFKKQELRGRCLQFTGTAAAIAARILVEHTG